MKKVLSKIFLMLFLGLLSFSIAGQAHALTLEGAPTNGLVGWWTFDEGTGTRVYDRSGNLNTGAVNGSGVWATGKLGQALSFNGSTTYVDVGNSASEKVSGAFAFSAWIYPTASAAGAIVTKNNSSSASGSGFYAFKNSSNSIVFILYKGDNTQVQVNSASAIPLNAWTHVVGVYSGSTIVLYINGVAVTPVAATSFSPDTVDNLQIGKYAYTNSIYFPGKIDDVRFYNRALTASEASRIYALGSVGNATINKSVNTAVSNGLVGWWTFDGSSFGSNIQDMSGNGNTMYFCTGGVDINCSVGILATSSVKTTGVIGQGVLFPYNAIFTTPAYLRTNPSPLFNLGAQGSWCSWTYSKEYLTGRAAMSMMSSLATTTYITIGSYNTSTSGSDGGYVRVGGTAYSAGTSKPAGTYTSGWHHSCSVFNANASPTSNRFLSYVDGALVNNSSAGGSGNIDPMDEVVLGSWGSFSGTFPGKIDDIRVYNRPLTAQEVAQIYGLGASKVGVATSTDTLATGLVGYWPFDGKYTNWRSNTVTDVSGSGSTGTLFSMSTSSSPVTGKIGQALRFNGTNQYVGLGNVASLSSAITISAWIKPTQISNFPMIVCKDVNVDYTFFIDTSNANKLALRIGAAGGLHDALSSTPITTNTWQHVVGTYDGTTIKVYINGVLAGSRAQTGAIPTSAVALNIGSFNNGGGDFFNGAIDDVRIYSRALSSAEILRLYKLGL